MKLSPRKELAARLIAAGHTQVDVYKDTRVSVTKQTMSAWCHEPDFIERVDKLKIDIVDNVQKILIDSAPDAAETLIGLVTKNGDVEAALNNEDIKMAALKLKGSLWILDRVLGKDKLRVKEKLMDEEDEDEDMIPDDEEIDSVLDAAL